MPDNQQICDKLLKDLGLCYSIFLRDAYNDKSHCGEILKIINRDCSVSKHLLRPFCELPTTQNKRTRQC